MDKVTQEDVDRALELKTRIADDTAELDQLKSKFKKVARNTEKMQFFGKSGQVSIGSSSSSSLDVATFRRALEDRDMGDEFDSAVTVVVGKAKDLLGKTVFDKLADVTTNAYGRVLIKALKG